MKRYFVLLLCFLLCACTVAPHPSVTDEITTAPTTGNGTTEITTTEPPVTEPPATEPPATEPPVTEPPVTEPPATEPPATEPPVTEPPATEPPATEPPATEPPATEPIVPPSNVLQFDNPKDGIYNYCPTIITEADGTRYIYYCTNKDSYKVIDYVGCRKGTPNADGSYTWSEEAIVLSPSPEGAWDAHHTCDPSVIKGSFAYNGTTYSYLMAYLGCTSYDNQENKIGLAVANSPMGPFVKIGDKPLVDFKLDPAVSVFQWGVGQASLVSMDKGGKVWLFYTRGDKNGTRTVVRECDLSNLDAPILGSEIALSVNGLTNLNGHGDFMNNADIVYDSEKNRFYAASDCHPNPTSEPNYIAGSFRVNYMSAANLRSGLWRNLLVAGKSKTGAERNHNVGIARDEYGHLLDNGIITVYYTVSVTGNQSLWSYRIYEYNIKLK